MLVASPVARPCHLPIHAVDSGLVSALMVDIGASTDAVGPLRYIRLLVYLCHCHPHLFPYRTLRRAQRFLGGGLILHFAKL